MLENAFVLHVVTVTHIFFFLVCSEMYALDYFVYLLCIKCMYTTVKLCVVFFGLNSLLVGKIVFFFSCKSDIIYVEQ